MTRLYNNIRIENEAKLFADFTDKISESNQQNAEDMLQFVANLVIKNPQVGATQWITYPAQLATDGIEKKFEFMIEKDDDGILVIRYLEVHDLA